jgi:hypothetical protein
MIEAILSAGRIFSNTLLNVSSNRPVTIGAVAGAARRSGGWHPGGLAHGLWTGMSFPC